MNAVLTKALIILTSTAGCFSGIAEDWQSLEKQFSFLSEQEFNIKRYENVPFVKRVVADRDLPAVFELLTKGRYPALPIGGLAILEHLEPKLCFLGATIAISSSTNIPFFTFLNKIEEPVSDQQFAHAMLILAASYAVIDSPNGVTPPNYRLFFYTVNATSLESWYTNKFRSPCTSAIEYLVLGRLCGEYQENKRELTPSMVASVERGLTIPGIPRMVYLSYGDDNGENYRNALEEVLVGPAAQEFFLWGLHFRKANYIRKNIDLSKLSIPKDTRLRIERQIRNTEKQ